MQPGHFNISSQQARTFDCRHHLAERRAGAFAEAADYWRQYLASDRSSEWAARARRGFPPDRKAALVGPQDRLPMYMQNQTVDSSGPKRQIWMSATPVRTGLCPEVRGRCLHVESTVR
jgi:hypothetical protein